MAIVVSDTSPIRALAHLDCLTWLGDLFAQVIIPPGVAHELRNPPSRLRVVDPPAWSFITVEQPQDSRRVAELAAILDLGEAEAIALAEQISADAVLIDELAARTVAIERGLTVIGTLGILLRAKQIGLCAGIEPLLVRLQTEINFFIAPALREKVLEQAGEHPPPR